MVTETGTNHRLESSEFDAFTGRLFSGEVPTEDDVIEVDALGKGLELEYERKVDFTKSLATRILETKEFVGERPLRDGHVTYLISTMKRNTFLPELVRLITCRCKEDGLDYRMNGQHTCWARMEMPDDYECPGKVSLSHYVAATMEDMRLLYASIDRGAPRTKTHVVGAHLAGTKMFQNLSKECIGYLSKGYSLYKWESRSQQKKHDGDDIAILMQSDDVKLVNTLIRWCETFIPRSYQWLFRSSVVAAMYMTFDKDVKAAQEFWEAVRDGIGFTHKDDPRNRLREGLLTCSIGTHVNEKTRQGRINRKASAEEVLHWSINAWNAWRSGKNLKTNRALLMEGRPKVK